MKPVLELIDEQSLKDLSTPSNFLLGKEILSAGGVEIIETGKFKVTARARAPGGQNRTVVLTAGESGLKCGCT